MASFATPALTPHSGNPLEFLDDSYPTKNIGMEVPMMKIS